MLTRNDARTDCFSDALAGGVVCLRGTVALRRVHGPRLAIRARGAAGRHLSAALALIEKRCARRAASPAPPFVHRLVRGSDPTDSVETGRRSGSFGREI